jgi:hypothetical protein
MGSGDYEVMGSGDYKVMDYEVMGSGAMDYKVMERVCCKNNVVKNC